VPSAVVVEVIYSVNLFLIVVDCCVFIVYLARLNNQDLLLFVETKCYSCALFFCICSPIFSIFVLLSTSCSVENICSQCRIGSSSFNVCQADQIQMVHSALLTYFLWVIKTAILDFYCNYAMNHENEPLYFVLCSDEFLQFLYKTKQEWVLHNVLISVYDVMTASHRTSWKFVMLKILKDLVMHQSLKDLNQRLTFYTGCRVIKYCVNWLQNVLFYEVVWKHSLGKVVDVNFVATPVIPVLVGGTRVVKIHHQETWQLWSKIQCAFYGSQCMIDFHSVELSQQEEICKKNDHWIFHHNQSIFIVKYTHRYTTLRHTNVRKLAFPMCWSSVSKVRMFGRK